MFTTAAQLANCATKKMINIESFSPIDVSLINTSNDAFEVITVKISTSSSSYLCQFTGNQWIGGDYLPTGYAQCPYAFGI